jgi:serine/threonine protein kinase
MEYLHHLKIIHRDLKTENILLTDDLQVKITDFGISKLLNDMIKTNCSTQRVGTPFFMAPEVIKSNVYNHKCDVFSFGIIMFIVLTQINEDSMYPETKENIEYLISTEKNFRPVIPENIFNNSKFVDFIGNLKFFFFFNFFFF